MIYQLVSRLLWWLKMMRRNDSITPLSAYLKKPLRPDPFGNWKGCCSNEIIKKTIAKSGEIRRWSKLLDTSCWMARLNSDCGEEFLHVGAIPTDQLSRTFLLPVDLVFGTQFLLSMEVLFFCFVFFFFFFFGFIFSFSSFFIGIYFTFQLILLRSRSPISGAFQGESFLSFSTFSPLFSHWILE